MGKVFLRRHLVENRGWTIDCQVWKYFDREEKGTILNHYGLICHILSVSGLFDADLLGNSKDGLQLTVHKRLELSLGLSGDFGV